MRERLQDTRKGVTHRGVIYGQAEVCPHCKGVVRDGKRKLFVTVNRFEDGRPGEVFVSLDEAGSAVDGLADMWAVAVSLCLQYGVPFEVLLNKFSFQRFQPAGMTESRGLCGSIVDYVVRFIDEILKKERV